MSESAEPKAAHKSWLAIVGGLLALVFGTINLVWMNPGLIGRSSRPILLITIGYLVASGLWLIGLRLAVRSRNDRKLTWLIFAFAIAFRTIQICAPPILELDLYRYLWDGIVASHGISPYRYAPIEVLSTDIVVADPQLERLMEIATATESRHTILSKVHFAEYTTIYPPVSQIVFALTTMLIPPNAGVGVHLAAIKLCLVLFDLATLVLVVGLIRLVGLHRGWAVAYGWSPLVVKEIANSGHLDSIATCFLVAAVLTVVRRILGSVAAEDVGRTYRSGIGAAALLALGTGAKLFPVVLAPLIAFALYRVSRRDAAAFVVAYPVLTLVSLGWMLAENDVVSTWAAGKPAQTEFAESKEGLTAFLARWRINTGAFGFVYQNAKPDDASDINRPWYVVIPNSIRATLNGVLERRLSLSTPAFFVARCITIGLFLVVYIQSVSTLAKSFALPGNAERWASIFLERVFLLQATFFFLQPTENPWYWVWCSSLVCFARNPGWLWVQVWLFVYYVRFWFEFSDLEFVFFGQRYLRVSIFDHVIVWGEHLGILVCLIAGRVWLHAKDRAAKRASKNQ